MSTSPLLDRLNVSGLPSPPNVAVQILELSQDPSSSIDEMGKVLSLDPALAAQVLRISNSAAYSRGREITTLPQAVMVLGVRTISIVALGFTLKSSIPNWKHESGMTDADLWRQNVATAVTARALARLARFGEADAVFLCGLLSRIGQLLLYTVVPDEYGKVLSETQGDLPTPDVEAKHLGICHQEAGGLLLEAWKLPNLITNVVRSWGANGEQQLDEKDVETVSAIVEVADAAAEMLFRDEKASLLQRAHKVAEQRLGLSGGEIDRMFKACSQEIADTLAVFDIATNQAIDCDEILETARQQLVNVSLGLVADLSETKDQNTSLEEENKMLAKASTSDALTGLNNRAALDQELESLQATRLQAESPLPFSIIMIDIDKFKGVNDTYGHAAGDTVLRSVGETLAESARATDFVARYGGEEFSVVLTNAGKDEATAVAERLRVAIEARPVELTDKTLNITASLGVSSSDSFDQSVTLEEVINCADQALYEAKRSGRNRVVTYTSEMDAKLK